MNNAMHRHSLCVSCSSYEGVRYAFVHVDGMAANQAPQWTITNLRRVSQAVPVNYEGSYSSSDPFLTRLWYVGAFTTRATFVSSVSKGTDQITAYLGSILMNRGDRIAFLGDAHVAQATALAAFGRSAYPLVSSSNEYCATIGNGIEPYNLMWVLSVLDYNDMAGDAPAFAQILPKVLKQLERTRDVVYPAAIRNQAHLRWSRDDDRMGFGFEFPDIPNAQCAYRALAAAAMTRFGAALRAAGNVTGGAEWTALGDQYKRDFSRRDGARWWEKCGMHGTGDAVNAGVPPTNTTDKSPAAKAARAALIASWFSDPLQLASLSPFESFFILKALLALGLDDEALFLVHRQWGRMVDSGATMTWERFDPQFGDAGAVRGGNSDDPPVNSMNDRTSMAHPWSSAATSMLSRFSLGVRPLVPGFSRWVVRPRFLLQGDHRALGEGEGPHRLEWVAGKVPTPFGPVGVAAHSRPLGRAGSLRIALAVTAPTDTTGAIELPVPKAYRNTTVTARLTRVVSAFLDQSERLRLRVAAAVADGGKCDPSAPEDAASELVMAWTRDKVGDNLVIPNPLVAGFDYLLCFEASAPPVPASALPPPAALLSEWDARTAARTFNYTVAYRGDDKVTAGEWVGKYGSKGYVLFNYTMVDSKSSRDLTSLPQFVDAVWASDSENTQGGAPNGGRGPCRFDGPFQLGVEATVDAQGRKFGSCAAVGALNASDVRVPQAPPGASVTNQNIGLSSFISAVGWKGSFHVDVKLKPAQQQPYNVSLYFADYSHWQVRQVIVVSDLASQSKAAQAVLVERFADRGSYLKYEASSSVRFRVHQVHSEDGDREGWAPPPMLTALFFD